MVHGLKEGLHLVRLVYCTFIYYLCIPLGVPNVVRVHPLTEGDVDSTASYTRLLRGLINTALDSPDRSDLYSL
jgi:hypothetical protein